MNLADRKCNFYFSDEDYDYGSIDDSLDDSDYDQIVDYDSSDRL